MYDLENNNRGIRNSGIRIKEGEINDSLKITRYKVK